MHQKLIREIGRSQRLDILTVLKRRGGMSVKELAAYFRMSYMGIKQHCLDLESEGYLDTWRRPKPVGRPELLYRLTARAQDLFPGVSNQLTVEVLEAVQQTYGPAAPTKLLFGIFHQRAELYRQKIKFPELVDRAKSLTKLREAEGYMTEFSPAATKEEEASNGAENGSDTVPEAGGEMYFSLFAQGSANGGSRNAGTRIRPEEATSELRIIEHHSPIEELLKRYPILARLERELFERVLNCQVRREDASAPGTYRCIFHLG